MAGPRSTFEQVWLPRIGEHATAQVRRSSYIGLVTLPVAFGLAIACSFAFGSAKSTGIALGGVEAAIAIGAFGAWIRSRMKLAAAVSEWFGVRISWAEMPRMRSVPLDTWQQRRGLTPAHK